MRGFHKPIKWISVLLAVIMISAALCAAPVNVFAAVTTGTKDGISWSYDDSSNVLTLSKADGSGGSMKNYTAYTGNGSSPWSSYRTKATTVVVNNGITNIGNYAFARFEKLENIQLCDSITSIGNFAFSNCSVLPAIDFPNSLKTIGNQSFLNCIKLDNIVLPGSITDMDIDVFSGCKGLETVTLSEGITTVFRGQFKNCTNLVNVNLPSTLTKINYYAFNSCSSLKTIDIPEGVVELGALQKASSDNNTGSVFSGCTSLENVTLPNSLKIIHKSSFYKCASLKNITLPEGLTTIGDSAFSGCASLSDSIAIPDSVTSIGNYAFVNCDLGMEVYLDNKSVTLGTCAFGYKSKTSGSSTTYYINDGFSIYGRANSTAHKYVNSNYKYDDVENTYVALKSGTNTLTFYRTDNYINNQAEMLSSAAAGGQKIEYLLNQDLIGDNKLTQTIVVPNNVVFTLCMNNHNIESSADVMFRVEGTGRLIIKEEGSLVNINGRDRNGYFSGDGSVYLRGGEYTYDASVDSAKNYFALRLPTDSQTGYYNYKVDTLTGGTQSVEADGNAFGLRNTNYKYFELLGVQKKENINVKQTDKGNGLRFIAVINEGLIRGNNIYDYGFVAVSSTKFTSTSDFDTKSDFSRMQYNQSHHYGTSISCLWNANHNDNKICGDYGILNNRDTTYKYVTLTVDNIPSGAAVAVRFYLKLKSGEVYYSDYTDSNNETYTGCCACYDRI